MALVKSRISEKQNEYDDGVEVIDRETGEQISAITSAAVRRKNDLEDKLVDDIFKGLVV